MNVEVELDRVMLSAWPLHSTIRQWLVAPKGEEEVEDDDDAFTD